MSERTINILAAIVSTAHILAYLWYALFGPPYGVTFAFLPILSIAGTFTFLAFHQYAVARNDNGGHPFTVPVPFRWVLALNYIGFAILLWWIIIDYFFDMPMEPWLRRLVWLQAALAHIWFWRRFVIWDRPVESRSARDLRQEDTDIRQDARDVTQDAREQRQGQTP